MKIDAHLALEHMLSRTKRCDVECQASREFDANRNLQEKMEDLRRVKWTSEPKICQCRVMSQGLGTGR